MGLRLPWKGPIPKPMPAPSLPEHECEDCEPLRRKAALYLRVIERYREAIEAGENKSVTELRALIVPDNPAVRSLAAGIAGAFRPYLYERDFPAAADKAYEYCSDGIRNAFLPLEFWLTPEDMVELKAADEIDKAALLCSLLIALKNPTAKVVVETQERVRHAFVVYEFCGRFQLMDSAHRVRDAGTRQDVMARMVGDAERKVVYEFNDREYNEW